MMTAVGMNDLGWVHEHQLGRMHFEKPIEMILCVLLVHYDLEHTLPGHAVKDVVEQNQDQKDVIDKYRAEKEDLDKLDGHWDGMMYHGDGLLEIHLDHGDQIDVDDASLGYDQERVGVCDQTRLISNEVLLRDDSRIDLFVITIRRH